MAFGPARTAFPTSIAMMMMMMAVVSSDVSRRTASRCDQTDTRDENSMSSTRRRERENANDEGEKEYDVYVREPRVRDLRRLVRLWEDGRDVWPWVWTWRNAHGPHHVYIGVTPDCVAEIERLALQNANGYSNNVTIVANDEELRRLRPMETWSAWQCGIIDGKVALLDVDAKILMLEDERIICFDRLVIAHRAENF